MEQPMPWQLDQQELGWLAAEADRLLAFGAASSHPDGGFAWLDDGGQPRLDQPVQLWITCRMTHCFALGHLMGDPASADLLDRGIRALLGPLRDERHGGWFAACGPDGPTQTDKQTYGHAFVVLAASSGVLAAHPDARGLLHEALGVYEDKLWCEADGMVVDSWDRAFSCVDAYRGLNANMHTVEAFLAASDAIGDPVWRERAARITDRVLNHYAAQWDWRLPEHFDTHWQPIPDYSRDRPADPFRPYGATVGHGLEWARLALALEASLDRPPPWLLPGATRLYDRAVADGWSVDGAPGFLYTTDWDGSPVVHERMHWVAAEATATAATLGRRTGDPGYHAAYERWWSHIRETFVDPDGGSWWHELNRHNRPSATVWAGKPDIYHALQATLVPRLPVSGSIAAAVADGRLNGD
jgi:mannose/cellobiose epimerase-like protein (N-acyl-D-glucosamine 2-epimerase family)